MTILRYLECSTSHMTAATDSLLETIYQSLTASTGPIGMPEGWPPMTLAKYEFGWFISVPEIDNVMEAKATALLGGPFPSDLAQVIEHAIKNECYIIRFDSDGAVIEELPLYDWT